MSLLQSLILVPICTTFLILVGGKKTERLSAVFTAVIQAFLLFISVLISFHVLQYKAMTTGIGSPARLAGITLTADSLSAFMLVTVNLLGFLAALYSIGYTKRYTDRWKFSALFTTMTAGINGVLVAGDIFNLYVFMEIAAVSAYFLVAFSLDADALEAAFKYAVMGSVASIFILLGIAFLYSYTSTTNMAVMAARLAQKAVNTRALYFASALFIMGFGLKAAFVPFHAWLPYAHSQAPSPVSAMLSGVLIKALGIYTIARIFFNIFGITHELSMILIVVSVLSMVIGGLLAFGQYDIKRLYAYSTISQVGYIGLALGVATPLALLAALFHLFNHSVSKALLFMASGSIEDITGTRQLKEMSGITSREPITGYTTLIGALSICGMPPLGGFWSKLLIILACIQAGHPFLALVAAFVSALTLAYYFRNLSPALFGNEPQVPPTAKRRKIALSMALPMLALAALSFISALVILPNVSGVFMQKASAMLANGKEYAIIMTERL